MASQIPGKRDLGIECAWHIQTLERVPEFAGTVNPKPVVNCRDSTIPYPAILVLGPFMKNSARDMIHDRAQALENIEVIDFENNMSQLMTGAIGVVAMGGYNTFCDILSYDKRAIIVPRTHPRQEQLIRATRAQELGLVTMLHPEQASDPHVMADALRHLPMQSLPSEADQPGLMDGLKIIAEDTGGIISARRAPALSVIEGRS